MSQYSPGDWVVFAKQKWSASPGPRARVISAATGGETYSYVVDKFWIVADRLENGLLQVKTRSGKEHLLAEHDARLRKPTLRERVLMRHKFPTRSLAEA